jgi:hypothetical protein
VESVRWVARSRTSLASFSRARARVKKPVRPAVLQQAVPEVAEHAVVEAGIVKLKAECVLEIDPAPHRLGSVTVGQVKQELQHGHRRQLCRRDRRPPVPGIPPGEALVPHSPSSRSRTHIAVVPAWLPARATRAVSAGTSAPRQGRIDISYSS